MIPAGARLPRLDALLRFRLERSGRRLFPIVTFGLGTLLVIAMLIVRTSDGPRAFLDGVVARNVTLQVVLVALPLAFSLAALGRAWPIDPAVATLAKLRGFSREDIETRLSLVVVKVAVRRAVLGTLPLAIVAALLSLPDASAFGKRLLVGAALVVVAIAVSLVLAFAGLVAARLAGGRGRSVLLAILALPQMLGFVLPGYPDAATPTGLYDHAVAKVLAVAPKLFRRGERGQPVPHGARQVHRPAVDGEEPVGTALAAAHLDLEGQRLARLDARARERRARRVGDRQPHDRPVDRERDQVPLRLAEPRRDHRSSRPRRIACRASRSSSRALIVSRLSAFFLPFAIANSSFARPFFQ